MYSEDQYLTGLLMYAGGVILVLLFLYLYRNLLTWLPLRRFLFVLLAAVLLMPVKAYDDMPFLAPAWFVTIFEALAGEEGAYVRPLTPLIIAIVMVTIGYSLHSLFFSARKRQRVKRRGDST